MKKWISLLGVLFTLGYMGEAFAVFTLTSTAFTNGDLLPAEYTCDSNNISPPLAWQGAPEKTQSFVLIVDDPDAMMGTWDHWILFNLPASQKQLPENITTLPAGALSGLNSWDKPGYGGPCPPMGTHRYYFKLFALDTTLAITQPVRRNVLEKAMENHILGQAQTMVRYQRHA